MKKETQRINNPYWLLPNEENLPWSEKNQFYLRIAYKHFKLDATVNNLPFWASYFKAADILESYYLEYDQINDILTRVYAEQYNLYKKLLEGGDTCFINVELCKNQLN